MQVVLEFPLEPLERVGVLPGRHRRFGAILPKLGHDAIAVGPRGGRLRELRDERGLLEPRPRQEDGVGAGQFLRKAVALRAEPIVTLTPCRGTGRQDPGTEKDKGDEPVAH